MSEPQQPPYAAPSPSGPSAQPASGYPQPGYPQHDYPQHGYAAAPSASSGGLGRTAFIIAIVTAVLGLLFVLASPLIITGTIGDRYAYQFFSLGRSVLGIALGATALILGVIAARRGSRPVLAGIAIGVGGVEVIGTVGSLASSSLYSLLY
ncbi:hypothetical protein ACFWHT_10710 [Microbacterium sp. NPDC058342]|uniref:hypothetical protein n=1 Tax=Microbacterium sp. NPDC058342 TaxID=3346454 RepID=UPI00364E5D17